MTYDVGTYKPGARNFQLARLQIEERADVGAPTILDSARQTLLLSNTSAFTGTKLDRDSVRAGIEGDACEYTYQPHIKPMDWQFLTLNQGTRGR
jgi:hypothetical protein